EGYQITSLVLPYFEAIYNKFNNAQLNYNIGIYGSRNVCSQVINAGYAQLAFVDGASTGYSGNMGFEMPKQWAFNQIKEGVNIEGIQVDNDKVSGLDSGFNNLSQNGNIIVENHTATTNATTGDDSSQNSIKIENVLINGFNFLLKDFTNIKLAPKNMKWIGNNVLCSGPFYFADKNAYIRFEGGYKAQLGNGSYVNLYYDDSGFSLDLLPTGYGINISPYLINLNINNIIIIEAT
ncbi:glycoside hydrolase domain-containing protein, partial [Sarcina ventriculi]|uniref:glycoside hydrolase domain-containing protein n=1 Tax=Sarcina ventriculi TaxID=1267 RepID=UPI001C119B72